MRATKIKTIAKPKSNSPESDSNLNISSQTPIEVALKIESFVKWKNGQTLTQHMIKSLHQILQSSFP